MTLKRNRKREIVRKQLLEKEQETTHCLVSKFSKEMLDLIQTKEREVLVSLPTLSLFLDPISIVSLGRQWYRWSTCCLLLHAAIQSTTSTSTSSSS